ncbi:hypothetical protein [Flavitalea sp.]|nr:hypothetical protein [Flavitalea sp.]
MARNPVFSNNYVTISEKGIDLTRSRFPYKHIRFSEIREVSIQEDYLIKNRNTILILSSGAICLLVIFLLQSDFISNLLKANTAAGFLIVVSRPVLAVIVIALGLGFLVYQSFLRSKVMTIKTRNNKKYSVRLKELEDDLQTRQLREFISRQTSK